MDKSDQRYKEFCWLGSRWPSEGNEHLHYLAWQWGWRHKWMRDAVLGSRPPRGTGRALGTLSGNQTGMWCDPALRGKVLKTEWRRRTSDIEHAKTNRWGELILKNLFATLKRQQKKISFYFYNTSFSDDFRTINTHLIRSHSLKFFIIVKIFQEWFLWEIPKEYLLKEKKHL